MSKSELTKEWEILQNQFDSYEKFSLAIKIVNIISLLVILLSKNDNFLLIAIPVLLWGIDAIWKTFQDRIGQRLLVIEKSIGSDGELSPFQFNTTWSDSRPGVVGLMLEYVKMGLKPTVLFPHIVISLLIIYLTV